jgi:hypothetical protein
MRSAGSLMCTRSSNASARVGRFARDALVAPDALDDLIPDAEHRIKGRHRLLEDHRDAPTAQRIQLARRQATQPAALEFDLTRCNCGALRFFEAQDRQRADGLAAARLTHQAHGLPRVHVEARSIDGTERLVGTAKAHRQAPDAQHGLRTHGFVHDNSCSRSARAALQLKAAAQAVAQKVDRDHERAEREPRIRDQK